LNGVQLADLNGDHHPDILGIGNSYAADPLSGYYDAGTGVCLLGDGKGNFRALPIRESNFVVDTDAKSLGLLRRANNIPLYVATANRDSLQAWEQSPSVYSPRFQWITPGRTDVGAELIWDGGKVEKRELYYGSGYLSQSTRAIPIFSGVQEVWLKDSAGNRRKVWAAGAGSK